MMPSYMAVRCMSVHGRLMRIQSEKGRKGELMVKELDQAPGSQAFLQICICCIPGGRQKVSY